MSALPPGFISYSSKDRPVVLELVRCLKDKGLDIWVDQGGIEAGTDWAERIIDALDRAQVVILCLSEHSCGSEEVFREISYASGAKKRLIPVLLANVELPRRLKYHLAGVQFVQLHQLGPERTAEEIVRGLQVLAGGAPEAAPAAPPSPAVSLPEPPHALIGRAREVAEVAALVQAHRLVTLTGPGGTGKTRLSIEVAKGLAAQFEAGVWFVELAAVTQARAVHPAITRTLGLREAETGAVLEALRVFLRERAALFVLDNLEQVAGGGVEIAALVKQCPSVRVLVSSRVPLRAYGEHEYPVAPLGANAAAELFMERARAIRPNLALDDATRQAVQSICRRLDGLPLALELAAARVRMLAPAQLAARLNKSLDLLTGGAKDLPARQQTLRGAIAWSYDLLAPEHAALFDLLGTFRGGWTLAAVEAIAGPFGTVDPFDGLAALVESSLVKQEDGASGEPRFHMLEMIREFAGERLAASEKAAAVHEAHRAYFLALAEEEAPRLFGQGQSEALARIEGDLDNLRAAEDRAMEAGDLLTALKMCAALWYFFAIRGYFSEGRERLDGALAKSAHVKGPDPMAQARATCLNAAAMLTYFQGDYKRMVGLAEECLALTAATGDVHNEAFGQAVLGVGAYCAGERDRGRASSEVGLRRAAELGDRWVEGFASNVAAIINYLDGHLETAPWERAHTILTGLNDRYWGTYPLIGLGFVLQSRDRDAESVPYFRDALRVCHSMRNLRGIALSLAGLGGAKVRAGELAAGARLLGASQAVRESIRSPIPAIYRAVCERNDALLAERLDAAAAQRERAAGATQPIEEVIAAELAS